MVIPRSLRDLAGVSEGTLMKVALMEGGQFLLTPQVNVSRSAVKARRKSRKEILGELAQTVAEIRQEAKEKGIDKMPMSEIRSAVTAMRRDLKKTSKRPVK